MTSRRGFTFLELMLALVIVSIIGAATAEAYRAAFRAAKTMHDSLEPNKQGSGAMETMRRDLESTLPPTGVIANEFIGTQSTDDRSNEADDLIFDAAVDGPRAALNTDVRQIEYLITPSGDDHVLVRRVTSNILGAISNSADATTYSDEIICRGVHALTLQYAYFDGANTNWLTAWDSTQAASNTTPQQSKTLPNAVQIMLELEPLLDSQGKPVGTPFQMTRVIYLPCSTATTQPSTTGGGG